MVMADYVVWYVDLHFDYFPFFLRRSVMLLVQPATEIMFKH